MASVAVGIQSEAKMYMQEAKAEPSADEGKREGRLLDLWTEVVAHACAYTSPARGCCILLSVWLCMRVWITRSRTLKGR